MSHNHEFIESLKYPTDGEHAEFPYPFYNTGIDATGVVINPNPWDEDDAPDEPFPVTGKLYIRPSPFGGLQFKIVPDKGPQYGVRPETVKPVVKETSGD